MNWSSSGRLLYLMDYELPGHRDSGLYLIESLGIQRQSVLVEGRYEEEGVRERCVRLGVRMIPISMVGLVPMKIEGSSS